MSNLDKEFIGDKPESTIVKYENRVLVTDNKSV